MIAIQVITGAICFYLGWTLKDYSWKKAAETKKIMVVDGKMYKVKQFTETKGGSVEE